MIKKILVVEDEFLVALHIKSIIDDFGFLAIINVISIEQAIMSIKEHDPILVLIDINLNRRKDGIALGKYLLEKNSIPYIYVTSYADKLTLDEVNSTRPYGYIVKPFKDKDLIATISIILNNYYHKNIDNTRYDENQNDPIPMRIRRVVDYINANLDSKITIDELVKLTEWRKDHFIRIFSKYMNITPYQYIILRRIEKSKSFLEETTITINNLAFEVGFENNASFYQAFKKIVGDTPENYRKRHQIIKK